MGTRVTINRGVQQELPMTITSSTMGMERNFAISGTKG